jgi:hypothetical protein
MSITSLSAQQLRQAADLKEQIEGLEQQLGQVLGTETHGMPAVESIVSQAPAIQTKGRRTFSAESRAKMAAAQKARWAARKRLRAEPSLATTTAEPEEKPKKKKASPALLKALAKARAARAAKLKAGKGTAKAKIIPAFRNARSEAAKKMWAKRRKEAEAKKADDHVPF